MIDKCIAAVIGLETAYRAFSQTMSELGLNHPANDEIRELQRKTRDLEKKFFSVGAVVAENKDLDNGSYSFMWSVDDKPEKKKRRKA